MYTVAYLALILYAVLGFLAVMNAPAEGLTRRIVVVYLTGILFLPNRVAFDLPGLPDLGKLQLAALVPLFAFMRRAPGRVTSSIVFGGPSLLIWVYMLAGFGTFLTNRDPLTFGPLKLPALGLWDATAKVLSGIMYVASTFWLARAAVRTSRDVDSMLAAIVQLGLLQVPICLIEMAMSPQMHRWVYGFSTIGFRNIMRDGGYKPVGFTAGGLAMAIFLFLAVTSAAVLARSRTKVFGMSARTAFMLLFPILLSSRNLGANIFGLVALTVIGVFGWSMRFRVAALLLALVIAYPIVRGAGWFEYQGLLDAIARYEPDRAASLWTRFRNEDELLARTMERPWFGWGGYNRSRVYDDQGVSESILDGGWIIVIGGVGIVGLASFFLPMITPALRWGRFLGKLDLDTKYAIGGIALIQAFLVADMLPNGFFTTIPMFVAGALTGLQDAAKQGQVDPLDVPTKRES